MPHHGHAIEWIFIGSSLVFQAFATALLIRSAKMQIRTGVLDRLSQADRRSDSWARRLVAQDTTRGELFRFCIGIVFCTVSLQAPFYPAPPPLYSEVPQALTSMVGYIATNWILFLWSYLSWRTDRQLIALAESERKDTEEARRREASRSPAPGTPDAA